MICQNCTHANREQANMAKHGYIRCIVARQPSHYMSEVMERDCKDFKQK